MKLKTPRKRPRGVEAQNQGTILAAAAVGRREVFLEMAQSP